MKNHDVLIVRADNLEQAKQRARQAHEDRDPRWHSLVTDNEDGTYTVERWWEE